MRATVSVRPALLAVLVAAACSDSTGPSGLRPAAELRVLQLAATAPPLLSNTVTFTACKGTSQEGRLFFDNGSGGAGEEYARLVIGSSTLLRRPDGTSFATGDCVDITMTIPDPTRLEVELQPAGLVFDPGDPAELRIHYGDADGVSDDIEAELAIWRQEAPGQPYTRLGTVVLDGLDEAEADLLGFTRYALAY